MPIVWAVLAPIVVMPRFNLFYYVYRFLCLCLFCVSIVVMPRAMLLPMSMIAALANDHRHRISMIAALATTALLISMTAGLATTALISMIAALATTALISMRIAELATTELPIWMMAALVLLLLVRLLLRFFPLFLAPPLLLPGLAPLGPLLVPPELLAHVPR